MARRPKNPINDISNLVGGWLGGRGPGTNPQVQAAMNATRAIASSADAASGGFGGALLADAQRMAQSGSSTPSGLYKTAAVNLAAAATGVGAAKVAGKAVSKVVESGVPAKVTNVLTGREVVIHGTGEVLLNPATKVPYKYKTVDQFTKKPIGPGAILEPRAGSPAAPDVPAVYGWNPKDKSAYTNIPNQVQIYASQNRSFGYGITPDDFVPQNQVVIGTAKKKDINYTMGTSRADRYIQQVRGPVTIKSIVSTKTPTYEDYIQALNKASKQAGQKLKGKESKLEKALKKAKQTRDNKRSVM